MEKISVFWFRRDLRLHDNCGLYRALKEGKKVLPIFIFDLNILEDLKDKSDRRLNFIHQALEKINSSLSAQETRLNCFYGDPAEVFEKLIETYDIESVHLNRDYEPYAIARDSKIEQLLEKQQIDYRSYKDQVIFEPDEILKKDGTPYLVYTPYSKTWLDSVKEKDLKSYPSALEFSNWVKSPPKEILSLTEMGFSASEANFPSTELNNHTMEAYESERNFPEKDSTSKLGIHLRFGTVSVREICRRASTKSLTFYKELIWREFFMTILFHFPHVVDGNYNSKYDGIKWRNNEQEFQKWCEGKTGYPLVDAGMRELNETGFMHNRVRMVVASFLTKHLLIDWKWGEGYFAEKLLDFELASNNGNWQWCAGTGVDASPYFRVFNPETQLEKFDKNLIYVRKWVKDYGQSSYPKPMVDHKMARERAISTYKEGINS